MTPVSQAKGPKSFDSPSDYEANIRRLVPGYELLHQVWPTVVRAGFDEEDDEVRVLQIGCGPGHELISLAQAKPNWQIDALDPSQGMVEKARASIREAEIDGKVEIFHTRLEDFPIAQTYDLAVAILVGHLIPDDGSRSEFLAKASESLKPGGILVLAELEDTGAMHASLVQSHLHWSKQMGLSASLAAQLKRRLTKEFHLIEFERQRELCRLHKLGYLSDFFQCLGLTGRLYCKAGFILSEN